MDELRNLQQMASLASGRFNQYDGEDFVLPHVFKEQVKEINSNTITYNKYSAIIETKGSQHGILNIFLPNQWFYIASYFTDFFNELQKYKRYALQVTTKERLKELNGNELTGSELNNVSNLDLDEASKKHLIRFITDYSWWGGAKTIDRGDFYVSPILANANLVNASQSFVADLCAFLANKQELVQAIINKEEGKSSFNKISFDRVSLQQIFYGAPGTGKSHTIKKTTENVDSKFVIRTTFHPDSDYSTFVGAYKPKMEVMPRYNPNTGEQIGVEKRIVYAYTPQAFLKAYTTAWMNPEQAVYLIIEEINRGNCAQIFGDLFQLLDRGDDGQSCYPIKADQDMQMHLMEVFAGYDALPENIRLGEELVLPSNLYIWATMNTSDQSLFPIDSAFKRRWEWKYIPITQGKDKDSGELMQWSIEAEGVSYDWWSFLEVMNKRVGDITSSEDKKLGFFFCKADGQGVISADKFVSKVMFYLWNDVFKDYPDNPIAMYLKEEGGEFTYGDFYTTNAGNDVVVREELVTRLLDALGVKKVDGESFVDEESEDGTSNNNFAKYSFNSSKAMGKSELGYRIMDKYLSEHPEATFEQIKQTFPDTLTAGVPNKGLIVELTTDLASYVRYYANKQYRSADGVEFRIFKQWTIRNIDNIIAFAKNQGWSIEEAGNWDRTSR